MPDIKLSNSVSPFEFIFIITDAFKDEYKRSIYDHIKFIYDNKGYDEIEFCIDFYDKIFEEAGYEYSELKEMFRNNKNNLFHVLCKIIVESLPEYINDDRCLYEIDCIKRYGNIESFKLKDKFIKEILIVGVKSVLNKLRGKKEIYNIMNNNSNYVLYAGNESFAKVNVSTLILLHLVRKLDAKDKSVVTKEIKKDIRRTIINRVFGDYFNREFDFRELKVINQRYKDLSKIVKYKNLLKSLLESNDLVYIPKIVHRLKSYDENMKSLQIKELINSVDEALMDVNCDNLCNVYAAFYILDLMSLYRQDGNDFKESSFKEIIDNVKANYKFNYQLDIIELYPLFDKIQYFIKQYIDNFINIYDFINTINLTDIDTINDIWDKYEKELAYILNKPSENILTYVQDVMLYVILNERKNR